MESSCHVYRFKPEHRLRGRSEFRRVFSQGKKTGGVFFSLHILSEAKEKRIGFSISRKVGNAVVRNLIKRRLREMFRLNQRHLKSSTQVISAKNGAGALSWPEMTWEILELWKKAGIWEKETDLPLQHSRSVEKRETLGQKSIGWIYWVYKKAGSPIIKAIFGNGCRFYPSCSAYMKEAIDKHGMFKGGLLSVIRLLKCNPWHLGGLDPVPGSKGK